MYILVYIVFIIVFNPKKKGDEKLLFLELCRLPNLFANLNICFCILLGLRPIKQTSSNIFGRVAALLHFIEMTLKRCSFLLNDFRS